MKNILIGLMLLTSGFIFGQNKDSKKILDAVKHKFELVNDYKVNAEVKLDMSFIKVPDMKATVYFKKPDKIKVESDGFAMLPKQGLKFSPAEFFKEDFTSLYVKSEIVNNRSLDVIKIIPTADSSDVILSTLWVDASESVVRKVEISRKRGGTTVVELLYDNYKYGLPAQIKLSFNLGDLQIPVDPSHQANQQNIDNKQEKKGRGDRGGVSVKGSVIMNYTNYIINKGIPDSFFDEKDKEKKMKID
jgi:outer membrane lipoprotein-sorting protein